MRLHSSGRKGRNSTIACLCSWKEKKKKNEEEASSETNKKWQGGKLRGRLVSVGVKPSCKTSPDTICLHTFWSTSLNCIHKERLCWSPTFSPCLRLWFWVFKQRQSNQTRSLEWLLIQNDSNTYEKGQFGHRIRHVPRGKLNMKRCKEQDAINKAGSAWSSQKL